MRENEEYKKLGLSWEEFCIVHAGVSRAYADRLIQYLEEFGTNYFRLAELTQISADTYRLVADSVGDAGMEVNGETIPINRQNRRRLDVFFLEARAIGETSEQRAELIVLLDQALEQLTTLIEEVGRHTIIVK
jgi:hypothetical protein